MRWRKIADEPAPEGEVVLFYCEPAQYCADGVYAGQHHGGDWGVAYDMYGGDTFPKAHVTHWMPMPEEPK